MTFENTFRRAFGKRLLKNDVDFAQRLYGSLTNTEWRHHASGEVVGFTFRYAGGVIAEIIGEGDYLDWYCSAPEGVVDPEVAPFGAMKITPEASRSRSRATPSTSASDGSRGSKR